MEGYHPILVTNISNDTTPALFHMMQWVNEARKDESLIHGVNSISTVSSAIIGLVALQAYWKPAEQGKKLVPHYLFFLSRENNEKSNPFSVLILNGMVNVYFLNKNMMGALSDLEYNKEARRSLKWLRHPDNSICSWICWGTKRFVVLAFGLSGGGIYFFIDVEEGAKLQWLIPVLLTTSAQFLDGAKTFSFEVTSWVYHKIKGVVQRCYKPNPNRGLLEYSKNRYVNASSEKTRLKKLKEEINQLKIAHRTTLERALAVIIRKIQKEENLSHLYSLFNNKNASLEDTFQLYLAICRYAKAPEEEYVATKGGRGFFQFLCSLNIINSLAGYYFTTVDGAQKKTKDWVHLDLNQTGFLKYVPGTIVFIPFVTVVAKQVNIMAGGVFNITKNFGYETYRLLSCQQSFKEWKQNAIHLPVIYQHYPILLCTSLFLTLYYALGSGAAAMGLNEREWHEHLNDVLGVQMVDDLIQDTVSPTAIYSAMFNGSPAGVVYAGIFTFIEKLFDKICCCCTNPERIKEIRLVELITKILLQYQEVIDTNFDAFRFLKFLVEVKQNSSVDTLFQSVDHSTFFPSDNEKLGMRGVGNFSDTIERLQADAQSLGVDCFERFSNRSSQVKKFCCC